MLAPHRPHATRIPGVEILKGLVPLAGGDSEETLCLALVVEILKGAVRPLLVDQLWTVGWRLVEILKGSITPCRPDIFRPPAGSRWVEILKGLITPC